MENLKWLEIVKQHNYDMAKDMIKRHIELYGEYKNNDDFIEKILKDAQELKEKEIMINELIENIQDPILKATFKEKYIHGKNWEQVAEILGYSTTHIQRIFKRALQDPEILKIKMELE